MTQEPDKSLSETTIVEKAALELVKSDMNTAEKAPQPLPDIRKPAPVKADNRAVRERKARQASREMYADKTVPRIRLRTSLRRLFSLPSLFEAGAVPLLRPCADFL